MSRRSDGSAGSGVPAKTMRTAQCRAYRGVW